MRYKTVLALAGLLTLTASHAGILIDDYSDRQLILTFELPPNPDPDPGVTPATVPGGMLGGWRTAAFLNGTAGEAFAGANIAGGERGGVNNLVVGDYGVSFLYDANGAGLGLDLQAYEDGWFQFDFTMDAANVGTVFTIILDDGTTTASWSSDGFSGQSGQLTTGTVQSKTLSAFAPAGLNLSSIQSIEILIEVSSPGSDVTIDNFVLVLPPPGTGTIGYWKNHPEAWPVDSIVIGGVSYTKDGAIAVMKEKSPPGGDKWLDLFAQLVAAKLNVAVGNESSCVDAIILSADAWLAANSGLRPVRASSSAWQSSGSGLHYTLDEYNNGNLCAPHRD